jgi:hypothetical protein
VRGHTDHGRPGCDVVDDHGARAHGGVPANPEVLNYRGADAHERAIVHAHATGQPGPGADVGRHTHARLVIDDATGVEDCGILNAAMGAHQRAGGDDHVVADPGIAGEIGGRMHGVDQVESTGADLGGDFAADLILADGDDRGGHLEGVADARQVSRLAQHGLSVDACPAQLGIGIDESDHLVFGGAGQDVEHDAAVTARANDETFHGWPSRVTGSRTCAPASARVGGPSGFIGRRAEDLNLAGARAADLELEARAKRMEGHGAAGLRFRVIFRPHVPYRAGCSGGGRLRSRRVSRPGKGGCGLKWAAVVSIDAAWDPAYSPLSKLVRSVR